MAKPLALWQRRLRPVQYRIIFWMMDVGAVGKLLQHGWMMEAAKQLEIHRITLWRQVELLVEQGILVSGKKKGEVILNLRIFQNRADRKKVRMMKATASMVKR